MSERAPRRWQNPEDAPLLHHPVPQPSPVQPETVQDLGRIAIEGSRAAQRTDQAKRLGRTALRGRPQTPER